MKKGIVVVPRSNPVNLKVRRTWGFNPVTRVHAPTKRQAIKKLRREGRQMAKDF